MNVCLVWHTHVQTKTAAITPVHWIIAYEHIIKGEKKDVYLQKSKKQYKIKILVYLTLWDSGIIPVVDDVLGRKDLHCCFLSAEMNKEWKALTHDLHFQSAL